MIVPFAGRPPRDAASARLVGGALVLSLPDAEPAAVWRLSLAEHSGASISLREEGGFWLLEATPTGAEAVTQTLACYRSHDKAEAALAAVAGALMRPPPAELRAMPTPGEVWARGYARQPWVWAAVVLILLLAIMVLPRLFPAPQLPGPEVFIDAAESEQPADPPPGALPGRPQEADDFFRNRQ